MTSISFERIGFGGDIEDSDGAWESSRILADGVAVGSVTVKAWDDGAALIERIDVDEAWRGRGIGTAAIEAIAAEHGATYIAADNPRAAALYARLGQDVTGDELWGHLDGGFGVYRV